MSLEVVWLAAIVIQITGILLIGDDVISARQMARERGNLVVADGGRGSTEAPAPAGHKPIKSILGIGLLIAGLFLALVAG